ncbi:centromere protein Chl4/mis15/CENP-N [Kalaharituber pfeilii]|nr:centromere protein Chl4/mis15/CENP-N [Kalaharituber pfeilii]
MPKPAPAPAPAHRVDHGPLPDSHVVPHSPALLKLLMRPSKNALCEIALEWLSNASLGAPQPPGEGFDDDDDDDDDDDEEGAELSIDDVKEVYKRMKGATSVTRKAVVERVVERDWRHGLNLWQIAHLECRCVVDNSLVHKWTAGRLHQQGSSAESEARKLPLAILMGISLTLPRFQASSFIYNLQTIIKPMIRSHCYAFKYSDLSLVLIRIQIHDSTGSAQSYAQLPPPKRIMFCAFPENAPFIFWNAGVNDPLRNIVLEVRAHCKLLIPCIEIHSLPLAMSRPKQRYELKSTALTAKSLTAMVHMRSSSRSAHALGAWSLYADNRIDKSPLDNGLIPADEEGKPAKESKDESKDAQTRAKRRKIAEGRFGTSGIEGDGKGIEKFEVTIKDKLRPSNEGKEVDEEFADFTPAVTVRFEGMHVFAGIRNMVEEGIIDGMKMPGWMTGEDGVNVAVVKDGRVSQRADYWY